MTVLDDMLAKVNAARDQLRKNGDFEQSMVMAFQMQGATLQAVEQQLAQAGTDPTKLAALQDAIGGLAADTISQGQKWADDVKANTGVGTNSGPTDPPPPEPNPEPEPQPDPAPAPAADPAAPAAAPQADPNAPKPS